ncbi:MAG: helix-turn-helix domain-containing protein [Haloferacaceae archaeon]
MTDDAPTGDLDAAAAETYFQSLADPTRVRVLAALARAEAAGETPLSYSDLQSRVGVRDNGRLNYHLSRLDGRFLVREDGAYALRPAGRFAHLVAVKSARDDADAPVETDADCPDCGDRLVARQADGSFLVACRDCGRAAARADEPFVRPSAVDRETFLDALDRTIRERVGFLSRGLCPRCRAGAVATAPADGDGNGVRYCHRCDACAGVHRTTPGELLLGHPDVVAFHRRHGVELGDGRAWALPFVAGGAGDVRSRDPWRVAVSVPVDGSDLTCVLDGDGVVVSTSTRTALRGI